MNKSPNIHICFVSHAAYGAMTGGSHGHIGGVERQTKLLAEHFVSEGYRVSVVVWGQPKHSITDRNGIDLIQVCDQDAGLPLLRFFFPRWTSLISALKQADADVYYHNCAEAITGQVAIWCRRNGRRFVYSVASDPEVMNGFPDLRTKREQYLFGYGLRNADSIIVQKRWQRDQLEDNFGLDSVVLPMPADPAAMRCITNGPRRCSTRFVVCWIGRIAPVKRPELFLDIVSSLPEIRFEMVGPVDSSEGYSNTILDRARTLSNLTMVGRVDLADISSVYHRASVLLCTSSFEGFPNTFVEAWAHGVPVISTVDPDDLLSRMDIGRSFVTLDAGVKILADLAAQSERVQAMGERARHFFLEQHEPSSALRRFSDHVRDVVGSCRSAVSCEKTL